MKKSWKTVVWIIELAFLFLALTAPFNPFINTKAGVAVWCYIMIAMGALGLLIACFKAYPPEEFEMKE